MLGRVGRVLRVLAVGALALEALYVVAINVFLSTSLFDKVVNGTPDAVDIHFARGWSLFPTRVHARKLSIRGTDSHIEWILRLDEVEFECTLLALVRKEFRVTMAHGRGITFRARFKVASPAATPERQGELPPVDSLGPVAFIPDEPPYAGEWDDREWHLWTVSIANANAERVREVWIERARFLGDAHVQGGFYLKPIRKAEVLPSTVAIASGSVTLGSKVAIDRLAANAAVAIHRFDPRTTASVLRVVSVSTDASFEIPDLENLGLFRDGLVTGKVAVPRLGLRIDNGVLRDGSELQSSSPAIALRDATLRASGAVAVSAAVAEDRLAGRVVVEHVETSVSVEVPRVTVAIDSAELALEAPFGDLHAVVDLPEARLADATRLDGLLGSASVRLLGGELRGSGHGEVWRRDARASAEVHVQGERLDVVRKGLRLRADAAVDASVDSLSLDTLVATGVHAALVLPKASVASGAGPLVRVRDLRASLRAREYDVTHPGALDADVQARALDLELDVGTIRLRAGSLEASLAGRLRRRVVQGTASLVSRDLGVTGPKLHVVGDARARVEVARWDFGEETLGGRADVALSRVRGGFHPAAASPDFVAEAIALRASGANVPTSHLALSSFSELEYALEVTGAELIDARALNFLLPSDEILAIESGRAYASVRASGDRRGGRGVADVRLVQAGLVLGQTHFLGDFELVARARDPLPSSQGLRLGLDVEGSHLAMRNVSVIGSSTNASGWAGDLMVEAGHLRPFDAPRFEADLTLRANDANPLLGLLFRETLSPVLAGLTHMRTFTAVTHVVADPRELVVSDLLASGGSLSVRGTLALRPSSAGGTDGAFVVHEGPWSVGLNLDAGGTHVRLFGLDGWYRQRALELTRPRLTALAMP